MTRIVVLGTGTHVGKTHVTVAMARALAALQPGRQILCVKPVETGMVLGHTESVRTTLEVAPSRSEVGIRSLDSTPSSSAAQDQSANAARSDAAALEAASFHVKHLERHPIVALEPAISPHLAARQAEVRLNPNELAGTVANHVALHCNTSTVVFIEAAGGAFSPLSEAATNIDLARALEPAKWLLVAPDSLGVLHDVRACLEALRAIRAPDALVLSSARPADASTGTNAAELARIGLPAPIAVFGRHSVPPLGPLFRTLDIV